MNKETIIEYVMQFNYISRFDKKTYEFVDATNEMITKDFHSKLCENNITTEIIVCKESNKTMFCWYSDIDLYKNNTNIPVLYLDAHYDVVHKNMIHPQIIGNDIIIGSCFDNRASCIVLCQLIKELGEELRKNKNFVTCIIFSDGEESGMTGICDWYKNYRVPHSKEKFIVLDVSTSLQTEHGDNIGLGVYKFNGDPIEEYIIDTPIKQQMATHRENYPDGLCYTHGEMLHSNFHCDVSRIGIPVSEIVGVPNDCTSSLHKSHTVVSISDIMEYYKKIRNIVININI